MQTYIIRRLLLMIPSVLLVTLLIFFMTHLIPGDVIDAVQAQSADSTLVDRETMERLLGLDQPLIVQYGRWMGFLPDRQAASADFKEKARLAKEAALVILNDVPKLPLALQISKHYWWPWVRNYYGEWSVHDNPDPYPLAFAWLDKDLKKSMGY